MPLTVGDLDALLYDDIRLSRPTSQATRMAALNHALTKLVAAIRTVRPERFLRDVVCTLPANQLQIPLVATLHATFGTSEPHQLLSIAGFGPQAPTLEGTTVLTGPQQTTFSLASIESQTYRMAMQYPSGSQVNRIWYDLIFPNDIPTLAIAPALLNPQSVLVRYYATPARYSLTDLTRVVGRLEERWETLLRAWAMHWMLRSVNDAEASSWRDTANELRVEMLSDVAKVTRGEHEAFGTAMALGDA